MMLESWRRELLDLGLRNPLLNYRLLKARGVRIVDERSTDIFKILVKRQKTMSFEAMPEAVGNSSPTDLRQPPNRHTDRKLQTSHSDPDLQKRLLNSEHSARTIINNRGINVLYLALGMLRWYESDSSTTLRRAPLLLIPVELVRADVNDRFHLRYTGVDIGENLSLRTKLQQTFDLALPAFPDEQVLDPSAYFQKLENILTDRPRWSIAADEISLGFFSFSKFLLYHDLLELDERRSPLLRKLLDDDGFFEPSSAFDDGQPLDAQMKIADSNLVLDADSSQMKVLLDVRAGRNLVVQGPPGTGKSQTITNLIADAVGHGKTVLFVSEKMAALDVVKRRLDGVGVGDGALVLHSHRTTRVDFYAEIRRTLRLGAVAELADNSAEITFPRLQELEEVQQTLINYSEAINRPNIDLPNLYTLYGRRLQLTDMLENVTLPKHDSDAWRFIAAPLLRDGLSEIRQVARVRRQTGEPKHHPFVASTRTALKENTVALIEAQSEATLTILRELQQTTRALTQQLGQTPPTTLEAIPRILQLAEQAISAPQLTGINVHSDEWATIDTELVAEALLALMQQNRLRLSYQPLLLPEAWRESMLKIRQGLMQGRSWWGRRTSPGYRQACSDLAGLCQSGLPATWEDQCQVVDAIMEVQRLETQIEPLREQLDRLFGDRLAEKRSHEMVRATYWLEKVHNLELTAAELQIITSGLDPERLQLLFDATTALTDALQRSIEILWQTVGIPIVEWSASFANLTQRLHTWIAAPHRIAEMTALNRISADIHHLKPVVDALYDWPSAGDYLVEWVEHAAITQIINDIRIQRPSIFNNPPHKSAETFRQLDRAFLQHNRLRLAQRHWQQIPRYRTGGLAGAMQEQVERKRTGHPIRSFVKQFAHVLLRTKPVFMMSPLAIAAFLPTDAITFDLVIFDEASQVRPAEALGAIARARQLVVVGDSRQLPPTSFFESLGEEGDEETLSDGPESILDLCLWQNVPERMLRWHYRSRHESLIAIANAAFYDHNLVIFPSPDRTRRHVGLNFRHVPDGVYERGKSRSNPIEAHVIAQAVMRHAKTTPDQTLGVATFSRAQRQAVSLALEQLRRDDSSCEPFFNAHEQEPFFVKNLENVQGDERDVILISVGYGKGQDGKLRLNFGPLNALGGERRLNVLTTRARLRCDVFANFRAAEIDLRRSQSLGVAALKRYLAFAETGELDAIPSGEQRPHAPFEAVVSRWLTKAGYQVVERIGSPSMQVDLAVVHPDDPQRFLVGIECDEDSYRAEATRDRDRIQGEVLTGLGWRVFRLYSADWWRDPAGTFNRLLNAIKAARRGEQLGDFARTPAIDIQRLPSAQDKHLPIRPLPPYQLATQPIDLHEIPTGWRRHEKYVLRTQEPLHFNLQTKQFATDRPIGQAFLRTRLIYTPHIGVFQMQRMQITQADGEQAIINYVLASGQLCRIRMRSGLQAELEAVYNPVTQMMEPGHTVQQLVGKMFSHKLVAPEIVKQVVIELQWIEQILAVESPIHLSELVRRIQRLGGRRGHSTIIDGRIKAGVKIAADYGLIRQSESFIWRATQQSAQPRNRRTTPNMTREWLTISPEEYKATLMLVVRDAVQIEERGLYNEVRAMLESRGAPSQGSIRFFRPLIDQLIQEGKLFERNGWFSIASTD